MTNEEILKEALEYEDINSEITTVKTFNAMGLFLADNCAWDYHIELVEEVNDETNN